MCVVCGCECVHVCVRVCAVGGYMFECVFLHVHYFDMKCALDSMCTDWCAYLISLCV